MNGDSPTVVYVLGYARSGTTLIGNILGESDGWFHGGEMRDLWEPALPATRRLCGCRSAVRECAVWQAAFSAAFDGDTAPGRPSGSIASEMVSGAQTTGDEGDLPRRRTARWLLEPRSRRIQRVRDRLCRALARTTSSSTIVDTSKRARDAARLARRSELDVRFVYVIRDVRGVAISRVKRTADRRDDGTLEVARSRLAIEVTRWFLGNVACLFVAATSSVPVLVVDYDDFARSPRKVCRTIRAFAGDESRRDSGFVDENRVELRINHTVSGNKNRWRTGTVDIVTDDSWRTVLRRSDRAFLSLVALPARVLHRCIVPWITRP